MLFPAPQNNEEEAAVMVAFTQNLNKDYTVLQLLGISTVK